jgi:hypothetical protein
MTTYVFDFEKFQKMIDSLNKDEINDLELIDVIVKSFNAEQFSYYYLLESIKYYMNKYRNNLYFEFAFYFFLKAFLITEENVDENSEQINNLNIKIKKIWKSFFNDISTQLRP